MEILIKLIIVLLLVFLNGYFVASEFSLISIRRTKIDVLVKKGNRRARSVKNALNNLDLYISSTQLGITLASLALGWIGEPAIARPLERALQSLPPNMAMATAHSIAIFVAFFLITFFHIVLGELVPKTIALQRSQTLSLYLTPPLIIFTKVFGPFIKTLNWVGLTIVRTLSLKLPSKRQLVHSEEEIQIILSQSEAVGVIEKSEAQMVRNVFRLGDVLVNTVMVPKKNIKMLSSSMPLYQAADVIASEKHSRYPVWKDSLRHIVGFVHIKDIYAALLLNVDQTPIGKAGILRRIPYISQNALVDDVLFIMRKDRVHIALVVDNQKKLIGLVTLEDLLESLVGEIEDEFDMPLQPKKKP